MKKKITTILMASAALAYAYANPNSDDTGYSVFKPGQDIPSNFDLNGKTIEVQFYAPNKKDDNRACRDFNNQLGKNVKKLLDTPNLTAKDSGNKVIPSSNADGKFSEQECREIVTRINKKGLGCPLREPTVNKLIISQDGLKRTVKFKGAPHYDNYCEKPYTKAVAKPTPKVAPIAPVVIHKSKPFVKNIYYTHLNENCDTGYTLDRVIEFGNGTFEIQYDVKNPENNKIRNAREIESNLSNSQMGYRVMDAFGEFNSDNYKDRNDTPVLGVYAMKDTEADTRALATSVLSKGVGDEIGDVNTTLFLGDMASYKILNDRIAHYSNSDGSLDKKGLEKELNRMAREKSLKEEVLHHLGFSKLGYTNPSHAEYKTNNGVLEDLTGHYNTALDKISTKNGGMTTNNLNKAYTIAEIGWDVNASHGGNLK